VEDLDRTLLRSDLGDLVLTSYERGGVVRRCTRPDAPPPEQIETFASYGATVLITNRPVRPESPLASRCFRVPLPEAGHAPVPDATAAEDMGELRARAVAWAARVLASGQRLPEAEVPFRGRMRDLTRPILQVLHLVAPDAVGSATELLARLDAARRAEAAQSWEARVAVAIWEARHEVKNGRLYIRDLLPVVNKGAAEAEILTAQQIGIARSQLGLTGGVGGRNKLAYIAWPGDEVARALLERYAPLGLSPASPAPPVCTDASANSTRAASSAPLQPLETAAPEAPHGGLGAPRGANSPPTGDAGDAGGHIREIAATANSGSAQGGWEIIE